MIDPHEHGARVPQHAKDERDEEYFAALNAYLCGFDSSGTTLSAVDSSTLPVIYIVGAPRSGTTLLSQLLSRYLPVGYIDNIVARFWQRPSVGIRLSKALLGEFGREGISFESIHGVTRGVAGPHEFGYFWRRWLALDGAETHKLTNSEASAVDIKGIQRVLESELLSEFGAPVIFKNVICGFQADILTRAHPASLFVWIRRDTEDVVRSILKCRMERYGSYSAWWSLKPSTFQLLSRIDSPVRQVLGQVTDCMREFELELSKPSMNTLIMDYNDVLTNPTDVLAKVCNALSSFGYKLSPLFSEIPVLDNPKKVVLPDFIENELATVFSLSSM
jgi:hypothetical protein